MRPRKSALRKILSFFGNLLFFGAPIVLVLVGLAVWNAAFLVGPIKPEKATPFQILLLLCVRDLEKQPEETVYRILDRVEETMGRSSGEMLELKMSPIIQKIVTGELERRRGDVREYTLFAAATSSQKNTEKNYEIISKPKPLAEKNIYFLFKTWYIREMDRYTAAPQREKAAILQKFTDDLKWWGQFNESVYRACQVQPLSLVEMAKEYEMTFEYYRGNTAPETYQRMLTFRDKLQAALVVSETKNRVNQFFSPLWK